MIVALRRRERQTTIAVPCRRRKRSGRKLPLTLAAPANGSGVGNKVRAVGHFGKHQCGHGRFIRIGMLLASFVIGSIGSKQRRIER